MCDMKNKTFSLLYVLLLVSIVTACRTDEVIIPAEYDYLPIGADAHCDPIGMYVLNEGNMGSNKASIDYVDFENGLYARNLYAERNPTVIKELGDVGNDLQLYGSKLYAVLNSSHKIEVMDARSLVRIGQIDIPNCRYINFHDGYAYISSYVGPIAIDPNAQLGAVYRVDTASLAITGKCMVGYQPEELEFMDNRIYVANSGGYRKPHYDNTVSVVDIASMRQIEKIAVAPNLHRVRKDAYGKLWVTSRGDEASIPSRLFVLQRQETASQEVVVTDTLDIPCSDMCICGDSLYFYSTAWSDRLESNVITYGIVDVRSKQLVTSHFITDGTEVEIEKPYGVAVNPSNGDIYVTDGKNYVSSGTVHCYNSKGKRKWSMRAGDIPAHMVFLNRDK